MCVHVFLHSFWHNSTSQKFFPQKMWYRRCFRRKRSLLTAVIFAIMLSVQSYLYINTIVGALVASIRAIQPVQLDEVLEIAEKSSQTILESRCRLQLQNLEQTLNRTSSYRTTEFTGAHGIGTYKQYQFPEHDRWVHSALRCIQASGAGIGRPPDFPTHYCFAHTKTDQTQNDSTKGHGMRTWSTESRHTVGACVPSDCVHFSRQLLSQMYNTLANTSVETNVLATENNISVEEATCIASFRSPWFKQPWSMFAFCIMSLLLVIMISASIHECFARRKTVHSQQRAGALVNRKHNSSTVTVIQIWHAFSITANMSRICYTTTRPGVTITCVTGLRTLSMIWTIIGHSYLIALPFVRNVQEFKSELRHFWAQIITNFTLSVDTFFVLSGCLTAYTFFQKMAKRNKNERLSLTFWLLFYRHRLIRIWPAYAFLMFMATTHYATLYFHQNWPLTDPATECAQCGGWWQNLLFLNTIIANRCLLWLWYLGDDFLFFALSPIFLLLLSYKPYRTIVFMIVLCALGCVCRAVIMYVHNLPPTLMLWYQPAMFNQDVPMFWTKMYIAPWTRFPPYLIGLLLGYALVQCNNNSINNQIDINTSSETSSSSSNSSVTVTRDYGALKTSVIWLFTVTLGFISVFGLYPSLTDCNWPVYHLVYGSLNRTVFASVIAMLIWACHTGRADLLNRILSQSWMVPLANTSYGAYLTHCIHIIGAYLLTPFPYWWYGHSLHSLHLLAHILLGYLYGLQYALMIEYPAINLERLWLQRQKPQLTIKAAIDPQRETSAGAQQSAV